MPQEDISGEDILSCGLAELGVLRVEPVVSESDDRLWNRLVEKYHYLGSSRMFGPRIRYLVRCDLDERPVALFGYNRASLKVGVRERFVGWNEKTKLKHIDRVVCQNRFLILPHVRVRNLASRLLALSLRRLKEDWTALHGISPFLVETFVDPSLFEGVSYKAAGWTLLGETKGFAKVGAAYVRHGRKKLVFVKVLDRDFLEAIPEETRNTPRPPPVKRKIRKGVSSVILSIPDYNPAILEECGLDESSASVIAATLEDYLRMFDECYGRSEQRELAQIYVKGLLSDLERKSAEPMALRYADGKRVRSLQTFMTRGSFDDEKLRTAYHDLVFETIAGGKREESAKTEEQGKTEGSEETGEIEPREEEEKTETDGSEEVMLTVDGCDIPKKGEKSAGVARQYCGPEGKTDNCQAGVFIGFSGANGYGLLDGRLYVPRVWFDEEHAELRKECGFPEGLAFRTKNEIASEMIARIIEERGGGFGWIGCDSAFGRDKAFLDSLPGGTRYFASVPSNTRVFLSMPEMTTENPGSKTGKPFKHPRPSVDAVRVDSAASDGGIPWSTVRLAEGTKGPVYAEVKVLRVVECRKDGSQGNRDVPGEWRWLYIRRHEDGKTRYAVSNAPEDTPLETLHRVATMRWAIEQSFKECKNLGMDHYEIRSYKGWHRHMRFVMLAHFFTLKLRLAFKKNGRSRPDDADGEEADHRSSARIDRLSKCAFHHRLSYETQQNFVSLPS